LSALSVRSPDLHSFPTRRSSDLAHAAQVAEVHRLTDIGLRLVPARHLHTHDLGSRVVRVDHHHICDPERGALRTVLVHVVSLVAGPATLAVRKLDILGDGSRLTRPQERDPGNVDRDPTHQCSPLPVMGSSGGDPPRDRPEPVSPWTPSEGPADPSKLAH